MIGSADASVEEQAAATGNSYLPVLAVAIILAIFSGAVLNLRATAFSVTDADSLAFLRTAQGLAMRADPAQRTSHPFEFVGEQMVEAREGVFYSKYPIGYPLLCAFAYRLGGPSAVTFVNPILGILSVAGIYLLVGSLTRSRVIGVWGALILATNPLHLMYALSSLSHTASLCAATWGMLFLWRWVRPGGGGLVNAALAGGLTAFSATIRYPDALLFLPLLAIAAWRLREAGATRRVMSELLAMAIAALIALAPQLVYQSLAFGSPWATGYGSSHESTAFGWSWFLEHTPWILHHLLQMGLMPVFLIGMAGIIYLCVVDPRRASLLGLWALPLFFLYCSYYFVTPDQPVANLRYYLTVLPAFIASALIFAFGIRWRWLTAGVVALCFMSFIGAVIGGGGDDSEDPGRAAVDLSEQLRSAFPEGTVILSLDRLLYFLDYEGRYTLYNLGVLTEGYRQWAQSTLASDAPSPFQRARLAQIVERVDGKTPDELAAMQLAIARKHLAEGRTVLLIEASPSGDDLRPFHNATGHEGAPGSNEPVPDVLRPFVPTLRATKVREFPFSGTDTASDAPDVSRTIRVYALTEASF